MRRALLLAVLLVAGLFGAWMHLHPWLGEIAGHPVSVADGPELFVATLCAVAVLVVLARAERRLRAWLALLGLAAVLVWLFLPLLRSPRRVSLEELAAAAPAKRRVLLVAVDGMTWSRVLPLVREGKMPTFRKLMQEGTSARLASERTYRKSVGRWGYWSPVVWTTIATGTHVDKHGIDDFGVKTKGRKRARTAATFHRKVPAFWNIWSAFDRSVGVVGWWASWPAEEVDGVVVSSNVGLRGHRGDRETDLDQGAWLEDTEGLTYPPDFVRTIVQEIGLPPASEAFVDRELFPVSAYPPRVESELDTVYSIVWQDRLYQSVAAYLLRHRSLDLEAVYFEGVDVASHLFWEYMDDPRALHRMVKTPPGFDDQVHIVDRYYGLVDRYVGELLREAGDDLTVVVCSDHGFGSSSEAGYRADHEKYGVLLARGPGIRRGATLNLTLADSVRALARPTVGVADVLPTLLYMSGLPISDELDGRVLAELFESAYLAAHPSSHIPSYGNLVSGATEPSELTPEEQEEYLKRLRGLGYVR